MDKRDIARIFEEIGLLLEIKGESPFKSRAYYTAARTIETLSDDLAELVASGRVRELKGIGPAIGEKLAELVGTGRLTYYEKLKEGVPAGLLELTAIPGLGPKKVAAIWQQLGITTVGELEYACNENRLVSLPGFGQKTQEKIREGLSQFQRRRGWHLYANVVQEAEAILQAVRLAPGVRRAELVGALRRRMEVVRTIDLLAAADRPDLVRDGLRQVEGLAEPTVTGSRIVAKSALGLPVEVEVVADLTGTALLAATGSEAHLTQLAERAARRGVPWEPPRLPAVETEEALYALLGLPFIPPELREGLGEIEAAGAGLLGPLVEPGQIQGVFHTHTTDSDGSASLAEMVEAARALGYRYIGISDHSQSAFYANGLKEDRIRAQHAAIEALRQRVRDIVILKGIEADILPDGSMDYPDEVLARFDFVIGSVHSRFNLSEEEQTARVLRALAHPLVTMLGHPTGRLLLSREGYRIDMHRVLDAARAHGKVVEINANPHRLDLDWRLCRYAKTQGVKVSINPDAHATEGLRDVPFGVHVARKGGLAASDVINTLGPAEILPALGGGRSRRQ
ncbi:DNA polymerase/3'-5' exonuclease PolX [Nitrospira sp. Kam-Ns4a]